MSIKSKLLWLGIGGGLIALFVKEGRRRTPTLARDAIPSDPEIEAALDLDALDVDEPEVEVPELAALDAMEHSAHGVDEDAAMLDGQSWFEELETNAIEGAQPEQPLPITEDAERIATRSRDDIPVADRGAGGPGGI